MALDKTTQDRIKADADKAYPIANGWHTDYAVNMGYIAGATAEVERAQGLVDALEQCSNIASWMDDPYRNKIIEIVNKALQQFKDGKGKDVEQQIPAFDYKSREWEQKMCQPASKEAIERMKERWIAEGKRECPDCGVWFKSEGRCPDCNPMG